MITEIQETTIAEFLIEEHSLELKSYVMFYEPQKYKVELRHKQSHLVFRVCLDSAHDAMELFRTNIELLTEELSNEALNSIH